MNGKCTSFTVNVIDTQNLVDAECSEISNMLNTKFISALFVGDRVQMFESCETGVAVSLRKVAALPVVGASSGGDFTYYVTISFDKESMPDKEVLLSGKHDHQFCLVRIILCYFIYLVYDCFAIQ